MPETPSDPEKRDDLPKPALDFLPRVRRLLEAKKQPSDHDLDSMKARVRKALNDLLSQSGLDDYDQKSHEIILQVIDGEQEDFDVEKLFSKVVRSLKKYLIRYRRIMRKW